MNSSYDGYMKKAHDTLVLQRENEIILEVRTTGALLKEEIEILIEKVDSLEIRMDNIENKFNSMDNKINSMDNKIGNIENSLVEIISLLKNKGK